MWAGVFEGTGLRADDVFGAASFNDSSPVLGGIFELDSPFFPMGDRFRPQLSVVEQGFTWNAAPVQADATEAIPLYHGGLHAHLGGTNGPDVASGAASYDDEIVML